MIAICYNTASSNHNSNALMNAPIGYVFSVTIPQAVITIVIAGPGSMIFTGRIRAFWQTVNMFGTFFCKNVLLSHIYRLEMLINAGCIGVLGIWQISELLSGK